MWKSLERSTLLPLPRKKANILLCLGSIASGFLKELCHELQNLNSLKYLKIEK